LLESIDLAGARGILVNVTAGMDMSIGEFDEVGNTIKEFASDNATVVVGTVIDMEMSEGLRVTVVATGLGQKLQAPMEKPVTLVAAAGPDGEVDYGQLDRPTVIRNKVAGERYATGTDGSMDYLDIPAFLRRQAD
jgi:cell division protein FtsZ